MSHYQAVNKMHQSAHGYIDKNLDPFAGDGGKIRGKRGKIVEQLIDYIWEHEFGGYTKTNDYIIHTSRKGNVIKKALDRHLYTNDDTLVCCVEAKSYLDACYMQRADWDSRIIKTHYPDVKCIVLALEKGLADSTLGYILDEGALDDVFFLCSGQRSSSKPIFQKEFFKSIEEPMYDKFCNYLEKCII